MNHRKQIAAQVFAPDRANRNLTSEPLTADEWRRVWEAKKAFAAALRQIVYEARLRESLDKLPAERVG